MDLKPLHDRVIVKVEETDKTTDSGIILTQTAVDKSNRGMVVATGPGLRDNNGKTHPLSIKAGDMVMFELAQATEMESEYMVMRESNVIAIIG
jgi:chaperonin GroES